MHLRKGAIKSCGCLRKETKRKPLPPKKVCKQGHRMTPGNVYLYSSGQRVCKTCEKARVKGRRATEAARQSISSGR